MKSSGNLPEVVGLDTFFQPRFCLSSYTLFYYGKKGKGSPITCKGCRGVACIYACHFSVSPAFDGGAYLLSVAALPSPPPVLYNCSIVDPGNELVLPDCESGVFATTLIGTPANSSCIRIICNDVDIKFYSLQVKAAGHLSGSSVDCHLAVR